MSYDRLKKPEVLAKIESRRKSIEEGKQPFEATIKSRGTYGDAIIELNDARPAYVCNLDMVDPPLIPQVGERWLVKTLYMNKTIILLCPVKRLS